MNEPLADRGHLLTEQRLAASAALDALSVDDVLRVINQQDATVPAVVAQALPAIGKLVRRVVQSLRDGRRLIYLGAGTSGRLGVLDASECPPTFYTPPGQVVGVIAGGDAALRQSSEGKEDDPHGAEPALAELDVQAGDTVVGIAAGGTTPYVQGGLRWCRARGATTALITCAPGAPGATTGDLPLDVLIELPVGPEVVTGSTRLKAGTATKLALNMISTATMVALGKVWGNLMVDLRATNAKLRDRAVRILTTQCDLSRDAAAALLDAAGGRVKTALVMAKRGVDAAAAEKLLAEHDGQLRAVIGEPK